MTAAYEAFLDYLRETATLKSCAALLGWDQETNMPSGGAELRARQLALLAGLVHKRMTAPQLRDLLEQAEEDLAAEPDDFAAAANVRETRRNLERAERLPTELVEEIARTKPPARLAWQEARKKDDFEVFRPWLEKTVELVRRKADALGYDESPYDPLLDEYEPGMTAAELDRLFPPLRDRLGDLLGRILDSGRPVDASMLQRRYPAGVQERMARDAAEAIGFDFTHGRLDTVAHPMCGGTGPWDVRLSTRYNERFFNEAFFGLLHEAGHGIYEQGLSAEHFGTPMGTYCSLGIHESQSRLWENFVGRSRGCCAWFLPRLKEAFPDALGDVEPEAFYRAVNEVKPSLIRVEADEVTYNLHVFLRYELEQALIGGALAPRDLPGAWNETFERYLRLPVPGDADGCLQDIHWSIGALGYFPTYTLGNLYGAQIHAAAEAELGDLDAKFANGEFAPLKTWLNESIHRHGQRFQPSELVEEVTGAPPSPEPLLRHLETKYGEIYDLGGSR